MTAQTQPGAVPEWNLADRMRKARETAGLDKAGMAEVMGVARQSVTNYENSHTTPRSYILRQWALVTGVPFWWLNGDEGDPGATQEPAGYRMAPLALAS